MEAGALVLVVGGRGFLGGFIVSALVRQGWRVRCLARPQGRTLTGTDVPGDLTRMLSKENWSQAIEGVSVVVNAAGILREEGRQCFEDVHYRAPLALAGACAEQGIRFVQVSALGHPADGGFIASKHRFDEALLALPVEAVVLRPSVVYAHRGSYGGTSLLRALAAFPWRHLLPGDGHWPFQPVSADDLARVVAAACTRGEPGMYEVGCEAPLALGDYQQTWRQWLCIPGKRAWHVPMALVHLQVRVCQILGRGPVNQTIWNMLRRGNVTAPGSHQRVTEAFGVDVRPLQAALATQPSQVQDRWAAQLYFLGPWLKWSIVALWLWSGVVGLVTPAVDTHAMARDSMLAHLFPVGLARGSALVDLGLGLWLAFARRPRRAVLAMLVMAAVYLVGFGVCLPQSFMQPLGGLAKNVALIPALAVLWVLSERR